MDSDAQIFLATSLSLSSVLIGIISLAVKSQRGGEFVLGLRTVQA
jgi:hypothetical protein